MASGKARLASRYCSITGVSFLCPGWYMALAASRRLDRARIATFHFRMAIAAWALSILGLLLTGVASLRLFKFNIAAPAFLDLIARMCRKRNFVQARKLCRAVDGVPVVALTGHALGLRLDRLELAESDGSYRTAPEAI